MEIMEYLRKSVNFLAGEIGARTYRDLNRLAETRKYITGELESFGYEVSKQPFFFNGNIHYNLIAELPGEFQPEKILVVGAHYDTVHTTPGADDNASGVAGMLGAARILAGMKLPKTVRFVGFGLEEPPVFRTRNMGSFHYAQSLREMNEEVEGMICLEMIGYFCDSAACQHYPLPMLRAKYPPRGDYISMVGNIESRVFTEKFAASFQKGVDLPVITLNALPVVIGIDFSDHWSFYKNGYKALMVTDTALYRNPHYHTPTDLPETLDYERMAKVVEGLKAAITAWSEEGGEPVAAGTSRKWKQTGLLVS